MKKQKLLSQKEYALHLGVSQQAVNRMIHAGKIPNVHGRIDAVAADAALAPPDVPKSAGSLSEATRRKEWALAGLREHELALKTGAVVDVAYVEKCQAEINTNIARTLLAIPAKLTPRLLGVSSPAKVKAVLEAEVRQCLSLLREVAVPSEPE